VRDVAFCTPSFSTPRSVPYGEFTLSCLLWALVGANAGYLLEHPEVPPLYKSGIYWKQEEPQGRTACPEGDGQELFLGIPQVRTQGFADCEDVACWRVSEVRQGRGTQLAKRERTTPTPGHPRPTIIPMPWGALTATGPDVLPAFFKRQVLPGQWVYHIIVFWPDGSFEDPSRVLGMGRHYGYQTR